MSALHIVVALVAAQRCVELLWSRRNTRRLAARGAVEYGKPHYPLIAALHAAWLIAMLVFIPGDGEPHWALLAVYVLLQPLRYWAIASLGDYWTTRVMVVPGAAPVSSGLYRWLRHPNYLVVAIEIPLLPAAFGAWKMAAAFGVLNVAMLAWRVTVEDTARRR